MIHNRFNIIRYTEPVKFSAHFGIAREPADDWFDPDLSIDTKLFLDPFLLIGDKDAIWSSAHATLIAHFARCYELLAKGAGPGTTTHKTVQRLLSFPEPSELCLGYTATGTAGSGSGPANGDLIIGSIVTAISAGLDRPEHIEEIGILNEGIGADRISDATCNVLKAHVIDYTKQVVDRHHIWTHSFRVPHSRCDLNTGRWMNDPYDLPKNPITNEPVLLLPFRFLNELPSLNAHDWFYSSLNEDLRHDLNVRVGQRVSKRTVVRLARRHPERIRVWAMQLRESNMVRGYNFQRDPLGIARWQDEGESFAAHHPITAAITNEEDLAIFVAQLISHFKLYIEEQGGWRNLWNDNGSEKPEEAAQLALLGLARPYCRDNGIELDREVNLGRGPVDFKFSSGSQARLLIEAKKLHNGRFWQGLEVQLPSYLKSDGTTAGWYLALQYREDGVSKTRRDELPDRVKALNAKLGTSINFAVIDARRKLSASKLEYS